MQTHNARMAGAGCGVEVVRRWACVPHDRVNLFRSMVADGFRAHEIAAAMGWRHVQPDAVVRREMKRLSIRYPIGRNKLMKPDPSEKTIRHLAKLGPSTFIGGPLEFVFIGHGALSQFVAEREESTDDNREHAEKIPLSPSTRS